MLNKLARKLYRSFRVVSYSDYMKLIKQLPGEQRKKAKLQTEINRLQDRYKIERMRHRAKVDDCESLKAMLPSDVLSSWKAGRRSLNVSASRGSD